MRPVEKTRRKSRRITLQVSLMVGTAYPFRSALEVRFHNNAGGAVLATGVWRLATGERTAGAERWGGGARARLSRRGA